MSYWSVQGDKEDIPVYVEAGSAREAQTKFESLFGQFSRLAPKPIIKELAELPEGEDPI